MNRYFSIACGLVIFACLIVVLADGEAKADTVPVVTTKHGVLKHSTLRDCRVATSLPCSIFTMGQSNAGWLGYDENGQPTWHGVWLAKPTGHWRWATKAEQVKYHLLPSDQVRPRKNCARTWIRNMSGERWHPCRPDGSFDPRDEE